MSSLPSRECGLKSNTELGAEIIIKVTPLAGVWIEISPGLCSVTKMSSLPSRECGLKFFYADYRQSDNRVTPLAGVWIEIFCVYLKFPPEYLSLPSRECGLKWLFFARPHLHAVSLPSRECGLKYLYH